MTLKMPLSLYLHFISFPKSPQKMLTPTSVLQLMSMEELFALLSWMLLRVGSLLFFESLCLSSWIDNSCSIQYILLINWHTCIELWQTGNEYEYYLFTVGFSKSKELQKAHGEGEVSNTIKLFTFYEKVIKCNTFSFLARQLVFVGCHFKAKVIIDREFIYTETNSIQ